MLNPAAAASTADNADALNHDLPQASATNNQKPQNAPECPIPEQTQAPQPSTPDPPPPTPPDDDLPPDQLLVIDLLLTGGSLTHVADAARIDRKTLYRWRHHDPRFQQFLERRRRELFDA